MGEALTLFDKEGGLIWSLVENNPALLQSTVRQDGYTPWQILVHIVTAARGLAELGLSQVDPSGNWFKPTPDFNIDTWNAQQQKEWEGRTLDDVRTLWVTVRPLMERLEELATSEHRLFHPIGRKLEGPEYLKLLTYHLYMHRQELEAGLEALKESEA